MSVADVECGRQMLVSASYWMDSCKSIRLGKTRIWGFSRPKRAFLPVIGQLGRKGHLLAGSGSSRESSQEEEEEEVGRGLSWAERDRGKSGQHLHGEPLCYIIQPRRCSSK